MNIDLILAQILVLVFSIVFHEVAHGWTADRLGDPTARMLGRLTLNPLPHIDPFMSIIMPILTAITFGFPFGGAKPVPVNGYRLRHFSRDMAIIAVAGPAANILLAMGFGIVLRLVILLGLQIPGFFQMVLIMGVVINLLLAGFNVLPIPPLDGSRVIAFLLPPDLEARWRSLDRYGIFILLLLIMVADQWIMGWVLGFVRFFSLLIVGSHII